MQVDIRFCNQQPLWGQGVLSSRCVLNVTAAEVEFLLQSFIMLFVFAIVKSPVGSRQLGGSCLPISFLRYFKLIFLRVLKAWH